MNPSRLFILRPVATTLLMTGLMLIGIVAYRQLPVSALPQVDYPTIEVLTFYPGASPSVMESSVTSPLERQFGQVPGLSQMTSTSSFGGSLITLQFDLSQNIDVVEQEVQAAINAAGTYLPPALPNPPIYSQGESCGRAGAYFGADFGHVAAFEGGRSGGYHLGAEDFAIAGRWVGDDQRRSEACGAGAGESVIAGFLWIELGGSAIGVGGGECGSGEGRY